MEHILTNQQSFAVFTMDAIANKWWQKYLKKPFCHVMIVHAWIEDGRHYIQVEDPIINFSNWSITLRKSEPIEVIHWYSYIRKYRYFCMENNNGISPKILKIKIMFDKYNYLHKVLYKLPFCTMYVAKKFRVATYAITPFQLYKVLKKRGCTNLL